MVDVLAATRAVHFAGSIAASGGAIFSAAVAGEAIRTHKAALRSAAGQLDGLLLGSLFVAVISGVLWLSIFLFRLEQIPLGDGTNPVTPWSVLTETQFGRVSALRLLVAVALAGICCLRCGRPLPTSPILDWVGALLGLILIASLAWCGHAGSGIGGGGEIHLATDVIHLVTAAIWVGGLVPLLILIRPSLPLPALARYRIVQRFSTLAVWSVALLALSGLVNTWFMTKGLQGLVETSYGNLILLKIGLFLVMLGFAALNRFRFTPRLATASGAVDAKTLRLLCWSIAAELTLGIVVIGVVGVLGQMEPMHMSAAGKAPLQRTAVLGSLGSEITINSAA